MVVYRIKSNGIVVYRFFVGCDFVFADVSANYQSGWTFFQALHYGVYAIVVEAHSIDQRIVLR